MRSFSDSIVYVDESGDHSLTSVDPNYPVFVLAFCIFHKAMYSQDVTTRITDLKFKHFGHDQVVLHEREIRKQKGDFQILFDPSVRNEFMKDITQIVEEAPFTLIASVIDKKKLKKKFSDPGNPYHIALSFGLESMYRHLAKGKGCTEGTLNIVFEERGQKEDDTLELEFRRAIDNNQLDVRLPFEIVFSNKQSNSAGLQLADLVARPIGRHFLKPTQANRAYDVIERKFRRDSKGKVKGTGLKVFPET